MTPESIAAIDVPEQIAPVAIPAVEAASAPRVGHARAIAVIGGAQAAILLAGVVRLKLVALVLGPVGVGIAGVIDLTAQLALQLGSLHIPTAALRFLPITQEQRGPQGFAWLYWTLLRLMLAATTLVSLAGIGMFLVWPDSLGRGLAAYGPAVILALAVVPLTGATNLLRSVLATLHRHEGAAIALLASSVLLVGTTYGGLRLAGLSGGYAAAAFVALVTVTTLHLLVRPAVQAAPSAGSGSLLSLLRAHPDIVRFSMTLYAVGFAIPLSYWVVRWTVLDVLGEREAGFLTIAYAIGAGIRAVFAQASTQFLIPLASRNLPIEGRGAEAARFIRTLLLLLIAGSLPLLLFPHALLLALSSSAFLPATAVVGTFILSEAIMVMGDAYRVLQLGLNDLKGYLITTCSGAVGVIAAIWWVAPRYGLFGTALLQVIAALLALAWSVGRLHSRHSLPVQPRTLGLMAYACLALATAVFVGREAPDLSFSATGVKVGLGLALLLGAALILPAAERHAIKRALRLSRSVAA